MPQTNIGSAVASDLTNAVTPYSVSSQTTDAATGDKETEWNNASWGKWLGYYKTIPELKAAIDAKAIWTIGKGFKADPETQIILEMINGWGKETFNSILSNAIRTMQIGGDAFIEIIKDDDGEVINLKSLDPGVIKTITNQQGIIIRYEQTSKNPKNKSVIKFEPNEILHLSRNRIADEIHGISLIESLETIILMRNEAMKDFQEVFHRYVKPKFIFHLDTDDTSKIAEFKAKNDAATGSGENMYVPKDAVVPEMIAIAANSTLNPLPWINALNGYFFQAAGIPQIIVGGSQEFTEATAKIAYLAFEQTIEEDQLYIEEQIREQLGYYIELEFPASLENELLSDAGKDGTIQQQVNQPSGTTAGKE